MPHQIRTTVDKQNEHRQKKKARRSAKKAGLEARASALGMTVAELVMKEAREAEGLRTGPEVARRIVTMVPAGGGHYLTQDGTGEVNIH